MLIRLDSLAKQASTCRAMIPLWTLSKGDDLPQRVAKVMRVLTLG